MEGLRSRTDDQPRRSLVNDNFDRKWHLELPGQPQNQSGSSCSMETGWRHTLQSEPAWPPSSLWYCLIWSLIKNYSRRPMPIGRNRSSDLHALITALSHNFGPRVAEKSQSWLSVLFCNPETRADKYWIRIYKRTVGFQQCQQFAPHQANRLERRSMMASASRFMHRHAAFVWLIMTNHRWKRQIKAGVISNQNWCMSAKRKHRVKQSEWTHPVNGFHKISNDNNGLKTVNFRHQVTNQAMMTTSNRKFWYPG